ncbi:hypothetical protein IUY40_19160, partial [Flavobacterium sp. ALJ2]|uniref:Calx-beta domain-containing protein n=1 Tax=Flavobacterium sp. ALJ2 TaxID=2786960 RepID=UPI001E46DB28
LSFSPPTANVKEGESTTIQVSLPDGFTATNDIKFNYTVGGTATSVDDYTALTGTGTIPAGKNFAAIVIDAKTDAVIELDETVTLTGGAITAGSLTGFSWNDAAKEATVTITDANDPAQKVLNFSKIKADVVEGLTSNVEVNLPKGVTLGYPLTVNYTISGTAINGTDYSTLTGTVTIPASYGWGGLYVAAFRDFIIEPDETVILTGGDTEGFTWGSDNVATVTIKDATGTDSANKVLSISPLTASVAEGESTTIEVGLPEGITVSSPIDINYSISGSATAGTDYTALTGVATIPAGSGTAEIKVD